MLANGRLLDTRRLVPAADGSPIDQVFTVSPDPLNATVYTAEIPRDEAEPVVENNSRSVLVSPAGRKRRVLIVEGAPGFEHSFMTRALSGDPGLEIDSVTRKGKNGEGQDTFFVQAGGGRSANLTFGFPATREQLFVYDALVIANVEGDFFSRAQLKTSPTSSPNGAAACWSSAAGRSRSAASRARRSKRCCRWSSTIAAAAWCARRSPAICRRTTGWC